MGVALLKPSAMKSIHLIGVAGTGMGAFAGLLKAAGYDVRALTRGWKPPEDEIAWVDGALDRQDSLVKLASGADAVILGAGAVPGSGFGHHGAPVREGDRMWFYFFTHPGVPDERRSVVLRVELAVRDGELFVV